jgi:hypothetical protein
VNREAELEPPSRVACSDLLDGLVIANAKPNGKTILSVQRLPQTQAMPKMDNAPNEIRQRSLK